MKKIKLEETIERKRRFTFLLSTAFGATLLLAFLQLLLSNHLATFGRELVSLSQEAEILSHENDLLAKEVAKEGSIATISQKAHTISLGAASNFLVLEEQESVALLHSNDL